jgi:hypothetical protein
MRRRISKDAKYGIKTVTNLATAEELPVQPAIKTGPACSVIQPDFCALSRR